MMTATMETKPAKVEYHQSPHDPRHFVPWSKNPGEFAWLPKRDLKIDNTYQRQLNMRAVHRIANHWNWIACGSLIVSLRTAVSSVGYYIIDGGHRWSAAIELPAVRDLP